MGYPHVAARGEALKSTEGVSFHVVEGGVHGSSMLVADRSQADLESAWALVEKFLEAHLGRP